MAKYAWYASNADSRSHSVGTRKPNYFGLFDTHGNAAEWCQGVHQQHVAGENQIAFEERADVVMVDNNEPRPLRGGFFADPIGNLSIAKVSWITPTGRFQVGGRTSEFRQTCGFRVARTLKE